MNLFHRRTPLRLQVNPIECGAVALGIILEYYGQKHDQSELNEIIGIAMSGSDAHGIIKAAEHFGLKASAKKVGVAELKATKKPSIAFVDGAHFVVVEEYAWGRFYINDPARGRYKLLEKDFRSRFSGIEIALICERLGQRSAIEFFPSWFLLGIIFSFFLIVLAMGLGTMWANIHDDSFYPVFYTNAAMAFLCGAGCYFLERNFSKLFEKHEQNSQATILSALKKIGPNFFETRPFPHYLSLLTTIDKAFLATYYKTFLCAILLVLCGAQAWLFWPAFPVLLSFYCAIFLLYYSDTPSLSISEVSRFFLKNLEALNSMGQASKLIDQELAKDLESLEQEKAIFKKYHLYSCIAVLIALLAFTGEVLMVRRALREGHLIFADALATFVVFILSVYVLSLFVKEKRSDVFRQSLLNELKSESRASVVSEDLRDEILRLREFDFSYPPQKNLLFQSENLGLKKGRIYALLGASSSGKSSLLRILGQRIALKKGHYLVNKDIEERISIALIDEKSELFADSLLENVRVYDERYSEQDIHQALLFANIEELFYNRPLGLLSPIEHEGANLSGGQKKRLLLARALLRNPSLLLLDNFFDNLDAYTSQSILQKLKNREITVVFTSSKEDELALSDEIIFIDRGVKLYSHEDLKTKHANYKDLVITSVRDKR